MDYANKVRDFIVSNFLFGEAGTLRDDTNFIESGIFDSTGILEVVLFLENTYNIKIRHEELLPENFGNVTRVAQFIARKLDEKEPHPAV